MVTHPTKPNLAIEGHTAFKILKQNKDIVILPADNVKGVLMMYKTEHNEMYNTLLSDKKTSTNLYKGHTTKQKSKIIKNIKKIKKKR